MSAQFTNSGSGMNIQLTTTSGLSISFTNSSRVITDNLVLYLDPSSYPGSGTTYTDLSGAGHNFTKISGTYITSPIKCFQAGIFNATNFITDNLTIQVWINTTGVGTQTVHYRLMQIMSAEIPGNPGDPTDFGFGINNTGKLAYGNGAADITVATTTAVNTGTWVNVAVTRTKSSGAVKLYINGQLSRSGTSGSGNALNVQPNLLIGAGTDGGTNWSGYMGVFLTYSSVLQDADILGNFNATRAAHGI